MIRTWIVPMALTFFVLVPVRVCGEEGRAPTLSDCSLIEPEARSRSGSEDIFVFLDSSLSMGPRSFGPWATGYMEPARRLLLGLVDCYMREGDFFLVSTFDSEARVEIAKELGSAREKDTLRLQVAALAPGRARYFRRIVDGRPVEEMVPPRLGKTPARGVLGGSWKTDLGEMLSLASHLIERYAEPRNRQVILFFTDGKHDPPEYTRFHEDVTLDLFLGRKDVVTKSLQIGIVAVPKSPGDEESSQQLADMFERLDPEKNRRLGGELRLLEPERENPAESFIGQLAEMLRLRILLEAPESVSLGHQVRPSVDETFEVHNETQVGRSLEISAAYFVDAQDNKLSLEVTPKRLDIGAGSHQAIRVRGSLDALPEGPIDGVLQFEFASAILFHPHHVQVNGLHQAWMERYGWLLQVTALVLTLVGLAGFAWWRRPQWIAVVWTDGQVVHTSRPKKIAISQSLKFGAPGLATLSVEGPESRLGEITRRGVDRFEFAFDSLFLDTPEVADEEARRVDMGLWYSVPGSDLAKISFRLQRSKKVLQRILDQTRTQSLGTGPDSDGFSFSTTSTTSRTTGETDWGF